MNKVEWRNQQRFLIMCTWVVLKREGKPNNSFVDEYRKSFESRMSGGATKKLPDPVRGNGKMKARPHDVAGHAQKYLER